MRLSKDGSHPGSNAALPPCLVVQGAGPVGRNPNVFPVGLKMCPDTLRQIYQSQPAASVWPFRQMPSRGPGSFLPHAVPPQRALAATAGRRQSRPQWPSRFGSWGSWSEVPFIRSTKWSAASPAVPPPALQERRTFSLNVNSGDGPVAMVSRCHWPWGSCFNQPIDCFPPQLQILSTSSYYSPTDARPSIWPGSKPISRTCFYTSRPT
jgi:hypothetical protein